MNKIGLIFRFLIIVSLIATMPFHAFAGSKPKVSSSIHWYCPSVGTDFEEYIFYVAPGSTFSDNFAFYFNKCKFTEGSLRVIKVGKFVTLDCYRFEKINPNELYNVELTVSIPEDTPPGWYNGTIVFVSNLGYVIPKPLKVSIKVMEGVGYSIFRKAAYSIEIITITDEFRTTTPIPTGTKT